MKLNFSKPLYDLDGNVVMIDNKQANLSLLLSRELAQARSTANPQKFAYWAEKLYKLEPLELDNEDRKILESQIRKSDQTAWVVAAWLNVLDQSTETDK